MQRHYLRGLLVCLVPCLLAAAYAFRWDRYRLGIDLAGGTILVYEINLERTRLLNEARQGQGDDAAAPRARRTAAPGDQPEGLSKDDMIKLAAQIKRRIDPADLKNVTVRPLGDSRLEVILPTAGAGGGRANLSSEEIEEVKRLVSQMGVLEFRILANRADDEAGVNAARAAIDQGAADDLAKSAAAGTPPDAPPESFEVKAESEKPLKVRYKWVELSPAERDSLGLQNAGGGPLWAEADRNRNKAFVHESGNEGKSYSMLLFSRAVHPNSPQAQKEVDAVRRAVAENRLPADAVAGKTPEAIYQAVLTDPKVGEQVEITEGLTKVVGPKRFDYYLLTRVSPVDTVRVEGDVSLSASVGQDKSFNRCVDFVFNAVGGRAFGQMTERNKPGASTIRSLAILLDERIVSAPTLNAVITTRGQISGGAKGFQKETAERLVNFLRNGSLNAQLREKPVSENTIGPTLGADTIRKGTLAVGLAFAAVLVFMVVYYRFAGLVACVALLANLLLTVGFMVGVNAAFTLPGLAGVVLMLGMAVDANVLIYERLREERNKGANLATAIRNGYDRAFPTIIDTHLTSIFTAIVLYAFGNDQLKGFAISLTVGLVISLFTSLYMTRLMFDYWQHKRWLTELKMLRIFERPAFDPMKYRFHFFTLTTVLTVLGLGLFLYRGENLLNVDFRGGTVYAGRLVNGEERAMTAADGKPGLRDLLGEANQHERLRVESVRWLNRPASGDLDALNAYVFDITYADKASTTVTLTQKPAGDTPEQIEADVRRRAQELSDWSVEQMFLSDDPNFGNGRSRYFTVRTTERQKELVQANLDRLLNDNGKALVASTAVTVGPVTGPTVELTFDRAESPTRVRDLLDREFRKVNAVDPGGATFELRTPPPDQSDNGKFRTMTLDVSKNVIFSALRKQEAARAGGGPAGAAVAGWAAARAGAASLADKDLGDQTETLRAVLAKAEAAVESRPEPERLEVFDSQLAAETRLNALKAILASWAAILVYLWFRFGNWTFGLAAVLCLIHDLCFTLGAIAACHYLFDNPFGRALRLEDFKIDLPAVAALLTLVGYSVSDTIVVFDRIREVRGKNPALTPQMINDSVNQTLSRTILAAATVFLVSVVLYVFGGEGVHLFAFVMVMGVLVGTYSSIFVAAPLLLMFGEGRNTEALAAEAAPRPEEAAEVEG